MTPIHGTDALAVLGVASSASRPEAADRLGGLLGVGGGI